MTVLTSSSLQRSSHTRDRAKLARSAHRSQPSPVAYEPSKRTFRGLLSFSPLRYNRPMQWRIHGRWRCSLRPGLVILGAVLAGWGLTSARGQAQAAQAPPQNDPANQHTITVRFNYDFQKNPSCAEKPTLKTCIKQFVVYDISNQRRLRLFSIPVPDGARGFVKGIKGQSPTRIFLPGTHLIAVTAQTEDGMESDVNAARIAVKVKSKTLIRSASSAHEKTFSYLDNGTIRVGVITDWGAAVGYLSLDSTPRNVINRYDHGREVQQSYYGSPDGTTWTWNGSSTPWEWNPVQAGDAIGDTSQVLTFTNDGSTIYAKTVPLDWAADDVPIQGYMEEWITLSGAVAHIQFKFTYTGSTTQKLTSQELPAMFVDKSLDNLVTYEGGSPWANEPTTSFFPNKLVGTGNESHFSATEQWAAYVDHKGWGVGVYTPDGDVSSWNAYIYSDGASGPTGAACSYVAPFGYWSFSPTSGTNSGPVYQYDVYLTIGTITDIRSRFYALHPG